MKKVSIFEKKWIDLVFESKNKAYGAYQLRQENPKTTMVAFLYGILFIASVSGFGLLLSSFGEKPVVVPINPIDTTIHVIDVKLCEPKPLKKEEVFVENKPETKEKEIKNPIIVKDNPDLVKKNVDIPKTPIVDGTPTGTGNPINTGPQSGGGGGGTTPEATAPSGPVSTAILDRQPKFPGGMDDFYQFVANNFKTPEEELDTTLKVFVSFVIELDGSLSNIKVIRDPGYGIGNEAIRVLKSLKTKWEPGIMNGQKVRTAYSLPIAVKVE